MRRLRWSGVVAALVAVAVSSTAYAADASLEDIIGQFHNRGGCRKAGISFSTIKNGTVAWGSVGVVRAQGGTDRPIRKDSDVFKIGSVTKTFTATLYALALSRGKLAATDRAQDRLSPNLGLRLPIKMAGEQGPQSYYVTVDELARHSSGLRRSLQGNGVSLSRAQMINKINASKLKFVPGSKFLYSNLGFAVLSLVLEHVYDDATIKTLLPQKVAAPLGMHTTRIGHNNFQSSNVVVGYTKNGGEAVVGNSTWPAFNGAGALRSTPADMEIFLKYNMGLLPHQPLNSLLSRLQTMIVLSNYDAGGVTTVGLAWQQVRLQNGDVIIWKDGAVPGFTSYVGFKKSLSPERTPSPYGVVILASQEGCPAIKIGKCALEYLAGGARQDCQ